MSVVLLLALATWTGFAIVLLLDRRREEAGVSVPSAALVRQSLWLASSAGLTALMAVGVLALFATTMWWGMNW